MNFILIGVFLLAMIGIGIWGMRKTKTVGDFFIGSRTLGPWMSALAYCTTYFSAVVFIGFAGKLGWGFGLNVLWIALGNVLIGSMLSWLVLGKRTRRMSQNLSAMTMPEFLQARFGGGIIKLIAALIIFIFLVPYSASVFKGLGHLFEASFHISFDIALLVMIGITGIYLVLGGYFAIALTDLIQGLIMVIGSIVMICLIVSQGGGLTEIFTKTVANYAIHIPAAKQPGLIPLIALVFMTSFGVWGMPQMVQKFYAIKNEKVIKTAAIVTTIASLIIVFAAYLNGAFIHAFFAPEDLPRIATGIAYDNIIPAMLTTYLPEIFLGVILLLVLSASMSTLSSLVLVSASSISIDFVQGYIRKDMKKETALLLIRILSAVFIVCSYLLARFNIGFIVTLMSLSWGAIAGSFMAPFFYGLFWKRTSYAGVVVGLVTGLTCAVALFFVLGPDNSPIASSIAMIVPFAIVPLVSLFTKAPDKAIVDKAFADI